jgi:GWxTD domain-containing protein
MMLRSAFFSTVFAATLLSCCVLLVADGCSGAGGAGVGDRGTIRAAQQTGTGLEIETTPPPAGIGPGVELFISIPPLSLTYLKVPDGFQSLSDIVARFRIRETEKIAAEYAWTETTTVADYERTQETRPLRWRKHLAVPPGRYDLEVTLEDRSSKRSGTRSEILDVIDSASTKPTLGRLYIATREVDGGVAPLVSFHVPEGSDSLLCVFDVYNLAAAEPVPARFQILKFLADTTVPLPPYFYPIFQGSEPGGVIPFKGGDTVLQKPQPLSIREKHMTYAIRLPSMTPGLYRIDVVLPPPIPGLADTTMPMATRRFYLFTPRGFPSPVTYKELIESAAYIATQGEKSDMRKAANDEERRKCFEEFWLKLCPDQTKAKNLIRQYYSRIERANQYFTVVQDGWRTDRGMVYTVMGPPEQTASSFATQTWYYPGRGGSSETVFVFKRLIRTTEGLSAEDYVLDRLNSTEVTWNDAISSWRGCNPR